MKILRVRILNLNSLRLQTEIDFAKAPLAEAGIFAITGDTGAGKTTILDAITLALYGKMARNKDVKEVMSYGAAESLAEVEFETRSGTYLANWNLVRAYGRPDGNFQPIKRELAVWNAEQRQFSIIATGVNAVNEAVEQLSGLDFDRFTRSVLLSQGEFAAFLRAGERERSELLERITGTEIYSQLSIASFERQKLERERLEQLRRQLTQLELLSEAEVAALTTERDQLQADSHQQAQDLQALRTRVQRYDQLEKLRLQQQTQLEEIEAIVKERESLAPEQDRYQRSRQLRPLAAPLARLQDMQQRQAELAEQQERADRQLVDLQQALTQARTALTEVEQSRLAFESEKQSQEELLRQVSRLDDRVEQLAAAERQARDKAVAADTEHRELLARHEALTTESGNLEREQQAITAWLDEHRAWEKLADRLPALEQQGERLLDVYQELESLQRRKADIDAKVETSARSVANTENQLEQISRRIEREEADFRQALPSGFEPGRSEILGRLGQAIVELQERRHNLEQLYQLDHEYQQMLHERGELEERIEHVQLNQQAVYKNLLTLWESIDRLRPEVVERREIYRQQQLIANYEKDREALAPDEPCPLCLSTDHPFRRHAPRPFVDRAKADLEKAEARLLALETEERRHIQRERDLSQEIERLQGDELRAIRGQLEEQIEKIFSYEERIAGLTLRSGVEGDNYPSLTALSEQLTRTTQRLDQWKQARQSLERIERQLKTLETQQRALNDELLEQRSHLTLHLDRQQRLSEQMAQTRKQADKLTEQLNAELQAYQQSFDPAKGAAAFQSLRKANEEYLQHTRRDREVQQAIRVNQANSKQLEEALQRSEQRAQAEAVAHGELSGRLEKLQQERRNLVGDLDIPTVRQSLADRAERLARQEETTRRQVNERSEEATALRKLRQSREKEAGQLSEQLQQLSAQLTEQLQALGIEQIAEAQSALLPAEEEQELEKTFQDLDRREAETRRLYRSLQEEWETQHQQLPADESADLVRENLRRAEAEFQQLQQHIGGLTEKIQQQAARAARAGDLINDIAQQEREFHRWARLNDLIGQADGKKFRAFAQGLTLRRLVLLANQHLQQLNGRYLIHKRPEADLDLEIVDTYQADNRRSMHTLSGGESFLVSLALALGLSDLAGRDTQIRSLFIDEGFGTLDDNSLDLALSTLENLQARGKTIGVISHVKALKERISTQIQVNKKSNGFSELEIVSA